MGKASVNINRDPTWISVHVPVCRRGGIESYDDDDGDDVRGESHVTRPWHKSLTFSPSFLSPALPR